MQTATKAPVRKVLAAGVGGGVGQYAGDIVLYIIEQLAGDLPDDIDKAVVGLVVFACAIAAGYFMPPAADEGVERA